MIKQESLQKYYTVDSKIDSAKTASISENAVCSFTLFLALSLKPDLSHPHAVSLTFGQTPAFLTSHYYNSWLTDFHSVLIAQTFVFYMLTIRIQWKLSQYQ